MKSYRKIFRWVLPFVLIIPGCKKETETRPAKPSAANSAATTPTAAPTSAPAASDHSADTTAKLAAAAWALKQDEIKNDPNGQWAVEASASSTYNDAKRHGLLVRQSGDRTAECG